MTEQAQEIPGEGIVEYTPTGRKEEEAITRGWKPEHLFEGDKEEWVDAKTFLMKGELMDTISKKTKQLKDMEKVIDKFSKYMSQQEEVAYKRAKEALLAEKAEALSVGDHYAVVQKDEEIKQLDQEAKEKPAQAGQSDVWRTAYNDWVKNNSWYLQDTAMNGAATTLGKEYVKENPNATPEDMYEHVNAEVRKAFPQKFPGGKNKSGDIVPSNFQGGNDGGGYKMSATERRIAERFVANGTFKNVAEYAASLKAMSKE